MKKLVFVMLAVLSILPVPAMVAAATYEFVETGGRLEAHEQGGRLTLTAENAPLAAVLAALADYGKIDIYLSKAVQLKPVSFRFVGLPVEEAVKMILADYNYSATFSSTEGSSRISSMKVYPKGKNSGALVPLSQIPDSRLGSIPTDTKSGHADTDPLSSLSGPAIPDMMIYDREQTKEEANTPLFLLERQMEEAQKDLFEEQNRTRMQIEATTDPERKQALAQTYAEQALELQKRKETLLNLKESMRRQLEYEQATQGEQH